MKKWNKDFWLATLERSIRTGAQTLLSMVTVGMGVLDVEWASVISITIMSMIICVLTCIVTGLPEASVDGFFEIDTNGDEKPIISIDNEKVTLNEGEILRIKVKGKGSE